MSLVGALTTAILPVLTIAAAGAVLGRARDVAVGPLATVTLYVLAPALVFHSLATTEVQADAMVRVAIGVLAFTLLMTLLAGLTTQLLGEDRDHTAVLALTTAFPNSGNYGIPLATFAFGAIGASIAVLYLAAQSVIVYTFGVVLASRGEGADLVEAATEVFRLPLLYAAGAAGLARVLDIVPSGSMMETIRLTGDAAIPVMLLLLGLQVVSGDGSWNVPAVAPAATLKLLIAPVVGAVLALALGFGDSTVARVFVLECAMPAAVTPLMLVVEYGDGSATTRGISGADFVGTTVLVTTLASVLTLTAVIAVLQSGMVI
ncbi:MAG: AEC family transporter [Halobacteriaceae archaeon]